MPDKKLQPIAAFEWASVAQYLVYISSRVGLAEINSQDVLSFPLARLGPDKLLRRKERALKMLEANIARLERFVGHVGDDLGPHELAVLKGMYTQYRGNIEMVKVHIETAKNYKVKCAELFPETEEEDNELF